MPVTLSRPRPAAPPPAGSPARPGRMPPPAVSPACGPAAAPPAPEHPVDRLAQPRPLSPDLMVPLGLVVGCGFGPHFDAPGVTAGLARLVATAVDPADPVEAMLLEHLGATRLHVAALRAKTAGAGPAAADVYLRAVVRLSAELRRAALAVEQHRAARRARTRGET